MAINYLDKEKLTRLVIEYNNDCKKCSEKNLPEPDLNNRKYTYIGVCIFKMSMKMGGKGNFSSYSWLDDMRGDAVTEALKRLKNFNPEKQDKPDAFAYLSTVMWYAMVRRIKRENKKNENFEKYVLDNLESNKLFDVSDFNSDNDFYNTLNEVQHNNILKNKEKEDVEIVKPVKKPKKKVKPKKKGGVINV